MKGFLIAIVVLALALTGGIMVWHQIASNSGPSSDEPGMIVQVPEKSDTRKTNEAPQPAKTESAPVAQQQSAPAPDAQNSDKGTQAPKKSSGSKDPLTDPLARVALSFVGTDAEAEAYWFEAINDPSHPPGERQDLIEDLNEEGFVDPKHPTQDELPLIMSRIQIIEELWPWAMDDINSEAFAEAWKDLWNLYDLALGGGEPIK